MIKVSALTDMDLIASNSVFFLTDLQALRLAAFSWQNNAITHVFLWQDIKIT